MDLTRDALLGQGVYLTDVSPWENSYKIALNNWDDGTYLAGPPDASVPVY